MKLAVLMLVGLLVSTGPALGNTTVYRCGQTYQQVPCKDGQAVDVTDARDPAQRAAAQQLAAAERRAADELSAERRERDQAALQPTSRTRHNGPVVAAPAKPVHVKRVKHPKSLEAGDKTLYAPRKDKAVPTDDAKMPPPG